MPPFDDLLDEAWQTLYAAEDAWQGWWFYVGGDTRSKFAGAFDRYLSAVHIATHAHFVATVIALGKLMDDDRRTVSIPRLLREARAQAAVDREVLRSLRADWKPARGIWARLKIIRDNNVAHHSASQTLAAVFQAANVNYGEVAMLLDHCTNLLNRLCEARHKGVWSPDNHVAQSLGQLWSDLDIARRGKAGV